MQSSNSIIKMKWNWLYVCIKNLRQGKFVQFPVSPWVSTRHDKFYTWMSFGWHQSPNNYPSFDTTGPLRKIDSILTWRPQFQTSWLYQEEIIWQQTHVEILLQVAPALWQRIAHITLYILSKNLVLQLQIYRKSYQDIIQTKNHYWRANILWFVSRDQEIQDLPTVKQYFLHKLGKI